MIYGRKRRTRILFSYVYEGGSGDTMVIFCGGYHGMSNKDIAEVREWLEEKFGKAIVITNWKVLHERS